MDNQEKIYYKGKIYNRLDKFIELFLALTFLSIILPPRHSILLYWPKEILEIHYVVI